jgi:hypothetical protein
MTTFAMVPGCTSANAMTAARDTSLSQIYYERTPLLLLEILKSDLKIVPVYALSAAQRTRGHNTGVPNNFCFPFLRCKTSNVKRTLAAAG